MHCIPYYPGKHSIEFMESLKHLELLILYLIALLDEIHEILSIEYVVLHYIQYGMACTQLVILSLVIGSKICSIFLTVVVWKISESAVQPASFASSAVKR